MKRNGFTLVEMLVSLGIFALLAAAGVGVLRSSIDVQSSVDGRLTALSGIARLNALLSSDLGQAVDRPSRAPSGQRPAFVGDRNSMQFVSGGRPNLDGDARSDLQRIEWRSENGTFNRIGFSSLDGSDEGLTSSLVRDVRRATFRYRLLDGSWSSAFTSTKQQMLPAAVELTMVTTADTPVVMVFGLPPGAAAQPPVNAPAGGPTPDQLPPSESGQ